MWPRRDHWDPQFSPCHTLCHSLFISLHAVVVGRNYKVLFIPLTLYKGIPHFMCLNVVSHLVYDDGLDCTKVEACCLGSHYRGLWCWGTRDRLLKEVSWHQKRVSISQAQTGGTSMMGESERGRDTGAGACGKRGLVPTLWRRCYRGCSRKTPQRCRLSSALQKQSIKGTALLILLWVLFPSYYDERLLE